MFLGDGWGGTQIIDLKQQKRIKYYFKIHIPTRDIVHGAKGLLRFEMFGGQGQNLAAADSSTNDFSIDSTGYFSSTVHLVFFLFSGPIQFRFATQLLK